MDAVMLATRGQLLQQIGLDSGSTGKQKRSKRTPAKVMS